MQVNNGVIGWVGTLRLEFRIKPRFHRQDYLTGLSGIDFHVRVLVLEAAIEMRGGDQVSGAVGADAVEEAGDDGTFTAIQADN